VLKLLRSASGRCFWGQRKRWPRWFWSLFVFSTSVDALSGDDKDNGDEGVLCWWSCRACLCVFLAFDCVVLMVFSALPLSRFFFLSSSLFFFTVMKGSKKEPLCSLVICTILSSHYLFLFSFFCSLPFLLLSSSFLSCFPSFFFIILFLFSLLPLGHQRGLIHSLIYLYLGKIQYINSRMQIPADLQ